MMSWIEYIRNNWVIPNSGFVSTFRVGNKTMCRALISKHGQIISTLDCWNCPPDHPTLISSKYVVDLLDEIHTPYIVGGESLQTRVEMFKDYEELKRFEIKI